MRVVLVVVSLLLVAGCVASAEPGEPAYGVDAGEVEDRLREVARLRSEVDAEVEASLAVMGEVGGVLTTVRSPSRAPSGFAAVGQVRDDLDDLDPDGLREDLRELAAAVDDARADLALVAEGSDGWEEEYLGAQDRVLVAVREHAAAVDALVQLIDRHRTTYATVLEKLAEVEDDPGEDPEGDRDLAEEAEEALSGRLEPVSLAQEELTTYAERREATAGAVNEATADAAMVFDRRPDGT